MFWEIFAMLCKSKGLTANAVCKELGFSNATATKWKKGAAPSGKSLQKIASYFGVSTDFLLTGKGAKKEAPSDDGECWQDIREQVEALPEETRTRILNQLPKLIELLADQGQ